MFCLGEESLAAHYGERKTRESLEELEAQRNLEKEMTQDAQEQVLERQDSVKSSATAGTEKPVIDGDYTVV